MEIRNSNPHEGSLIDSASTSTRAVAKVGNTSECSFWNGEQQCRRILHDVFPWLKSGPFQWHFQFGKKSKVTWSHVMWVESRRNAVVMNFVFGNSLLIVRTWFRLRMGSGLSWWSFQDLVAHRSSRSGRTAS